MKSKTSNTAITVNNAFNDGKNGFLGKISALEKKQNHDRYQDEENGKEIVRIKTVYTFPS